MNALKNSSQVFWAAGIFSIPFTRFILLWQSNGPGGFNPYTSSTFYLSEAFIWMALVSWWIYELFEKNPQKKTGKKEKGIVAIVIGFGLLATSMAQDQTSALLALIHIFTAIAIVFLLHKKVLPLKSVKQIFVPSMALQGLLAILQISLQHSTGLSILGEPLIGPQISGVAKFTLAGNTFLRAYGTFPHANILAGFSLVALFCLDSIPKKVRPWLGGLVAAGFLLAFSKAAFIGLFVGMIITKKINPKQGVPLLILMALLIRFQLPTILEKEFVHERIQYLKISAEMFWAHPEGVGTAQFTERMQEFTDIKLQPWQFQPVHNTYLLILNEYAIWGLGFFLLGIKKWWEFNAKNPEALCLISALLIMGLFDHYLVTLPQGILLTSFIMGFTTNPKSLH